MNWACIYVYNLNFPEVLLLRLSNFDLCIQNENNDFHERIDQGNTVRQKLRDVELPKANTSYKDLKIRVSRESCGCSKSVSWFPDTHTRTGAHTHTHTHTRAHITLRRTSDYNSFFTFCKIFNTMSIYNFKSKI